MRTLGSQFFCLQPTDLDFSKPIMSDLEKLSLSKTLPLNFDDDELLYNFIESYTFREYIDTSCSSYTIPRYGDFITHLKIYDPSNICEKIVFVIGSCEISEFCQSPSNPSKWNLNIFKPPHPPCFLLNLYYCDVKVEIYYKYERGVYDRIIFSSIYHRWSGRKRVDVRCTNFISYIDDERYMWYMNGYGVCNDRNNI